MALDQLYQQLIIEHNRSPRNFGPLADATHSARGFDALCGDDLLFELRVEDGTIRAASFSGEACAVTKACASLLTEWLPGRTRAEVAQGLEAFNGVLAGNAAAAWSGLGPFAELSALSEFPSRQRNARLPWRTALEALASDADRSAV